MKHSTSRDHPDEENEPRKTVGRPLWMRRATASVIQTHPQSCPRCERTCRFDDRGVSCKMQEAYATIQAASRLIDAMGVQQVTGRSEELAHMGRLRGRRMRRGELRRSMGGRRFKRHGDDRGRELTKAISAPSQTKKTYPECPRPSSTTSQTIRTTATTRRAPERRTRGEKRCFASDNPEPNRRV